MTTLRLLLIALTLLSCAGCTRRENRLLPEKVAGIWTTDDVRYRDRFLELSPAFVITVTGAHDMPSVELIDRVEVEHLGQEELFTVYSTDHAQGTQNQTSFTFTSSNGGEIRFKNQGQIWSRDGGGKKRK